MAKTLQLVVLLLGLMCGPAAFACSWVPASIDEVAAARAIAIGKVVDERIRETPPGEEYYRSRSVVAQLLQPLRGSIHFPVRSAISCGSSYAPVGSRVIVYMIEPGLYGVVEATPELERLLRKKLGLPANNSFKPNPLRGSA